MEEVEEEEESRSPCVYPAPDINLERMLAYCSFVRHGWCLAERVK